MALVNPYCTLDELQGWNRANAPVSQPDLERAINACSRGIDKYCRRHFWQTESIPRLFAPDNAYEFDFGAFNDLHQLDALATDTAGDGTFDVTWSADDYELLPLNPDAGPERHPYESIRRVASKTFPYLTSNPADTGRSARVRITGIWGWEAVPDAINQACVMHAARIFNRKESPQGVAGWGDFGAIRVRSSDPDVINFLEDYRLGRKVGLVRIR